MTDKSKKISFLIEHMDPMGQGVSKQNNEVVFIPKTLPGETGQAIIYKKSKGVNFAYLSNDSLSKSSELRTDSACRHFTQCQGCQYLHCSHATELNFKKQNLARLLSFNYPQLNLDSNNPELDIEIIANPTRFHYRNRIQLHYDVKKKQIGFINKASKQIQSVKDCLLPEKEISDFLKDWYPKWQQEAKGQKPRGHVEVMLTKNTSTDASEIQVHWNKRYSNGGFTQVNSEMNEKMLSVVTEMGISLSPKFILDLFGGNGNLSNQIQAQGKSTRIAVDLYPHGTQKNEEFVTLDLDQQEALKSFLTAHLPLELGKPDLLIVDPPRKGFKFINDWCHALQPKHLLYVSCNPATLARDLQKLPNYLLKKVVLLDMFPGTYHYETIVLLQLRS